MCWPAPDYRIDINAWSMVTHPVVLMFTLCCSHRTVDRIPRAHWQKFLTHHYWSGAGGNQWFNHFLNSSRQKCSQMKVCIDYSCEQHVVTGGVPRLQYPGLDIEHGSIGICRQTVFNCFNLKLKGMETLHYNDLWLIRFNCPQPSLRFIELSFFLSCLGGHLYQYFKQMLLFAKEL